MVRHTMLFFNILTIAWLLLCNYASYAHPQKVPYIALLSLTTFFALALNAVFVVLWLFTESKWRSLLSLVALVVCYKLFISVWGIHIFSGNDMNKTGNSVKVMTWNVHGLGLYDRPVDKHRPDSIIRFIDKEAPDILCLTEFITDYKDALKPHAARLLHALGYKEYRFVYDNDMGEKIYVGTAIFSKYPLSNLQEIELGEYIKMLQCDITLAEGQMMRVFFTHLQSYFLNDNEKALLEDVKKGNKSIEAVKSKSLIKRFDIAYKRRALQADSVARCIANSPYPVLVCGDLNDMPGSYTYNTIKGKLKDAFTDKGRFLSRTYNQILPTLRIDYIFYDPALFSTIGFHSPFTPHLSDHSPVIANFSLKNN